ncbi:MAG: serine/threonine protein kinase [Anaerolineae bacterium]|nr:serine/threonine protein kinase [Anaerolineae bacterium]MCO5205592.1 serine/threonine protein kinase [Anaerolineae bacterium]
MPPQMFDSYQITRELGRGGFSVVYEAYDHQLQRYVALKILNQDVVFSHTGRERFKREVEAARRLHHAHIIRVYRAGFHNNRAFLSMALIRGGTVANLRTRQPIPPPEVTARIIRHTARALEYAHRHDIVHRDVKPSNILLDQNGRAYLSDFGMARVRGMATVTRRDDIIGSVQYMSPEQVHGLLYASKASDIYSLGVVLYELVTGRVPFGYANQHSATVLSEIVSRPPPRPSTINPQISPVVESILLKALHKDPAQRFRSPLQLAAAYQGAALRQPVRVMRPKHAEQGGRHSRQRRPASDNQNPWLMYVLLVGAILFLMLILTQ